MRNPFAPSPPTELDLVEKYLIRRVGETGGMIRKVKWPEHRGAPDRLCGWPVTRRSAYVECKRPSGMLEPHQLREHNRLRAIGIDVRVIDTREKVDAFVEEMTKSIFTGANVYRHSTVLRDVT